MPYNKSIYLKAEHILTKRRNDAEAEAKIRADEIKLNLPEVDEIQGELSKIGLEISTLFFYNGNAEEKVLELRSKSKALVAKRSEILRKNGYDEDAMTPDYICPV